MNENILAWNVENWVSVSIMGIVTLVVFGFLAKLYQKRTAAQ